MGIKTIHFQERNYPCDICGKLFTRANTLRTHRKIHEGIKQFQCLYCVSVYGEKRNLMNHITKNHPDHEPKFRRVTSSGSVIVDDRNNPVKQNEDIFPASGPFSAQESANTTTGYVFSP